MARRRIKLPKVPRPYQDAKAAQKKVFSTVKWAMIIAAGILVLVIILWFLFARKHGGKALDVYRDVMRTQSDMMGKQFDMVGQVAPGLVSSLVNPLGSLGK